MGLVGSLKTYYYNITSFTNMSADDSTIPIWGHLSSHWQEGYIHVVIHVRGSHCQWHNFQRHGGQAINDRRECSVTDLRVKLHSLLMLLFSKRFCWVKTLRWWRHQTEEKSTLVYVMAWCRIGSDSLTKPMIVNICDATRRHQAKMSWIKVKTRTNVWQSRDIPVDIA